MKHFTILLAALVWLTGCAPHLKPSLPAYMASKKLSEPTLEQFPHCQGYGCPVVKNVRLSKGDWKAIEKAYGKIARTPEEERYKISRAVGTFEKRLGPLTGTDHDKAGTFLQTGTGQLDCVDESTNTTIYMILLEKKGLIQFHTIEQPQVRYPLVSGRGWMHQTAVIREIKTGQFYAVDSWFEDNGKAPYVLPIEPWLNGWHPELWVKPKI
jgi:hypothetical protein